MVFVCQSGRENPALQLRLNAGVVDELRDLLACTLQEIIPYNGLRSIDSDTHTLLGVSMICCQDDGMSAIAEGCHHNLNLMTQPVHVVFIAYIPGSGMHVTLDLEANRRTLFYIFHADKARQIAFILRGETPQ
jgi:hypothetical protein